MKIFPLLRPVWAEIKLDNLAHNIKKVKNAISSETKIMAIVKADAYGHGAIMASRTFLEHGAEYLGVATLIEAIELREKGIEAPILILGYTSPYVYKHLFHYKIMPTIFSFNQAKLLNKIARERNESTKIHLKVETGMQRIGFNHSDDLINGASKISDFEKLEVEGIFTHFAVSDSIDKSFTKNQYKSFKKFVAVFEESNYEVPIKHVSNSAAIIDLPDFNLDMVRPGIMLYGFYPSQEVNVNGIELKPAIKLVTELSHRKFVQPRKGIGYGLTYVTKKRSLIGTIPIGYADGLIRNLSNIGYVAVKGKQAPIVGRICMDQSMIDITGIKDANIGERVTVFGDGSEGEMHIEEVSEKIGTITHEVLCGISRRVPRIYFKKGEPIDVRYYLID